MVEIQYSVVNGIWNTLQVKASGWKIVVYLFGYNQIEVVYRLKATSLYLQTYQSSVLVKLINKNAECKAEPIHDDTDKTHKTSHISLVVKPQALHDDSNLE